MPVNKLPGMGLGFRDKRLEIRVYMPVNALPGTGLGFRVKRLEIRVYMPVTESPLMPGLTSQMCMSRACTVSYPGRLLLVE